MCYEWKNDNTSSDNIPTRYCDEDKSEENVTLRFANTNLSPSSGDNPKT